MRADPASILARGAQLIREHGGGVPVDELIRAQRVAAALRPRRTPEAELPTGASKLGGCPDLPPSMEWPRWAGYRRRGDGFLDELPPNRLAFLAQLNIAELPDCSGLLPESGWLYFFYDADGSPWGDDPMQAEGFRVLYFGGEASALRRIQPPADLATNWIFHSCAVAASLTTTIPIGPQLDDQDEASASLLEVAHHLAGAQPHHRVLGWPTQLQGSMELHCELIANGLCHRDWSGAELLDAERLEAEASEWVPLLHLDSDSEDKGPSFLWGDCGTLYFWIKRRDLAALRFDRTWCTLQSG